MTTVLLSGPTGVGKSTVIARLAGVHGWEVIPTFTSRTARIAAETESKISVPASVAADMASRDGAIATTYEGELYVTLIEHLAQATTAFSVCDYPHPYPDPDVEDRIASSTPIVKIALQYPCAEVIENRLSGDERRQRRSLALSEYEVLEHRLAGSDWVFLVNQVLDECVNEILHLVSGR